MAWKALRLGDSNSKNVSVEEHEYFERLLTRICLLVGENEKITNITGYAPYWTNTNLLKFVNNSHQIPFDSHLNVALVAPVGLFSFVQYCFFIEVLSVIQRAIIWDEGV